MKKKVLILAGIPWNTTIQRHHYLAEFLKNKGYDVYFVEKIPSSSFSLSKIKSVILKSENKKVDVPTKGINILKERFVNPHEGIFKIYNQRAIRKVAQQVDYEVDLIITYLPVNTTFLFLKEIQYKKLIYDCVRDFQNWGGYPTNITILENRLLNSVDLILTDSYYLTEKISKKVPFKNLLQFLPSVDNNCADTLSAAVIKQQIKRIVYFGAVSNHIDFNIFNLLNKLGYEVHLIGSIDVDIQEKLHKNINCHGFINDLEKLSQSISEIADAIIIPYKGNMDGVIPAKLMQCIVTGLPIFINKFYDSEYLKDLLYVYDSHEELQKELKSYNFEEHKQKQIQMRNFYKGYLEKNNFNTILDIMEV